MGTFLLYSLKVAFCLALLYLPYSFLLRKETFFTVNRFALLLMLLLAFLLPLCHVDFSWLLLSSSGAAETTWSHFASQMQEFTLPDVVVSARNATLPVGLWVVCVVYLGGVLVCLGSKVMGFLRFFRFRSKGCLWQDREEGVVVYCHTCNIAPLSWMNSILISEQDYRENGREILLHERAHIRYGHSWDMLLVSLAQVLQWFNPFVWMLATDLRDIHEFQADLAVLSDAHTDPKNYQLLLIRKAVGSASYAFANSFNHSLLKKRITMMMKKESSPWAWCKYAYVLPVVAVCTMACSQSEKNGVSDDKGSNSTVVATQGSEKTSATAGKDASQVATTAKPVPAGEVVFDVVEKMPEFPDGGMTALMNYLSKNLHYPIAAAEKGMQGRVTVQFIVSKDGEILEPKVLRSVDPLLDKEALRVVSAMPKWKPGTQRGKAVNVRFTIPVTFKLQ